MPIASKAHQLIEEIKLFIQYSVPEHEFDAAVALVDRYKNNSFLVRLLREYYAALPEAREEAVVRVARVIDLQGVHLVVVATAHYSYLYALSADHILLLGEYRQPVDTEVLSFFGFESQEEFLKVCPPSEELEEFASTRATEKDICPVCGVAEEENHLLGCTVEICPWCAGQLSYCNCRFEQLKIEEIADEDQLEAFVDMLTTKGRIPYRKSQAPAYPGTSGGLDDTTTRPPE